mmetsp:Transcript_32785/g.45528  ORF Transcript_32785/g.45528 Transcript_32785/m.45528 type:complete len:222 (+) Transcript_32785:879-1544(+)
MLMLMSPEAMGADISRAVRYWEDTAPEIVMSPPGSPPSGTFTVTGGHPVPNVHSASTPSCFSPSTRSWMGRSLILGTPSSTYSPRPAAATHATRGRIAVPALPRNNSPSFSNLPAQPVTEMRLFSRSSTKSTPKASKAPTMYLMSSESKRLVTLVVPSATAAIKRIRFDKDLDPGRRTVPSIFLIGARVIVSSVAADCARTLKLFLTTLDFVFNPKHNRTG